MNNANFAETIENVRKHRGFRKLAQIIIIERRTNQLALEPSYHTTKFFTKHVKTTEIKENHRYWWIILSV